MAIDKLGADDVVGVQSSTNEESGFYPYFSNAVDGDATFEPGRAAIRVEDTQVRGKLFHVLAPIGRKIRRMYHIYHDFVCFRGTM